MTVLRFAPVQGGGFFAALRPAKVVTLLHSAPVQGVSRPPHAASRDCRTAHPLPVRTRVRLHRNAGSRGKRQTAGNQQAKRLAKRCSRGAKGNPHPMSAHPHAAQRAVPGCRGGLGRVGADLASAGSMRPTPSPARHVSTVRLATTHVSRTTAPHTHRAGTPPHKPAQQKHHDNTPHASQPRNTPTRLHTSQPASPDTHTQTSPAIPAHIPITTP